MATVTLTSQAPIIPPELEIPLGSNAIPIHNFNANYPPGTTSIRDNRIRELNIFDFATDLYPPVGFIVGYQNINYIDIVEIGYYADINTRVPVVTLPYLFNNQIGPRPLEVGDRFALEKFSTNLQFEGEMGIEIRSEGYNLHDVFYIKFRQEHIGSGVSNIGTINMYRGSDQQVYSLFNSSTTVPINRNSITTVKTEDFNLLNFHKSEGLDVILANTGEYIRTIHPEVEDFDSAFMSKIIFTNEFYETNFPRPLTVINPRLTYGGVPVVYGQAISYSGIQNGYLKFDSIGLNNSDIETIKLYFFVEGFASGDAFI